MDKGVNEFSFLDNDDVDHDGAMELHILAFEGANVINGKSAIKKSESQSRKPEKLSVAFNDEATTTHEYQGEIWEEVSLTTQDFSYNSEFIMKSESNSQVDHNGIFGKLQKPKSIKGSYHSGRYLVFDSTKFFEDKRLKADSENDKGPQDHIKPSEEGPSWSSETSADILF